MKQVKLTSENDTLHVDDVDVSKGVYARFAYHSNIIFFTSNERGDVEGSYTSGKKHGVFGSLKEYILACGDHSFFTLDGRRIVTEKELTVEDLTLNHHIGFIDNDGVKGFVQVGADCRYHACVSDNKTYLESMRDTSARGVIQMLVLAKDIKSVFVSESDRRELYAWLAE